MKKRTVRILTGLAVMLVAWGVIYAIWVGISAAKLRRAYAALEKDGRPMRAEEVIPPAVEDIENAALLYESAALLLKAMPARWDDMPDEAALSAKEANARDKSKDLLGHLGYLSNTFLKESLAEDERAKLEPLIGDDIVTQTLATVRLGTERPSCRFDIDYEAGLSATLPHLLAMKGLLRILGAKARLEAEAGQPLRAWNLALTQLRFADALRTEPTIISQVVRISNIAITCRTLQHLCAVAPPSPPQLEEVDRLLEGLDDIGPLVVAVDAERVMIGEFVFRQPRDKLKQIIRQYVYEDYVPDLFSWFRTQRILFKPALLADHAAYMRFMHENARLLEGSSSRDEYEAREREAERREGLARALMIAMRRINHLHACMTAEIHITRAGLGLLRHKQEHGTWPENLEALGQEKLDDPFADGLLRYRPEAERFVLYSVGEDREDNGGVAKQEKQEKDFDIVWRFPNQPTR